MSFHHSPKIVTNGLAFCLDAANRKSYEGSGTVWRDLVSGKNGTLTNGPTFNSANCGNIVFDGTNDYVTCGPVYNFGGANSVATILFWAKGSGQIFSNQRTNGSEHGWIQTNIAQNFTLYIDAYDNPPYGETFTGLLSSTPYPSLIGQWNLYNMRINRPAHQYTMGINQYFTSYTRNFFVSNGSNFNTLEIGRINNFTFNTSYFAGQIACVSFYNKILTDREILQNFNTTKGRFGV